MDKTSKSPFLLAFVFLLSNVTAAFAQGNHEQIKEHIWDLETRYVTYFRDAEHDKVIPMWHEKFLGWPDSESKPNNKNSVISYLKRVSAVPQNWKFKIERKGFQLNGNVAITHMIHHLTFSRSDGSSVTRSSRITHTWIKESGNWKILGGMSSRL